MSDAPKLRHLSIYIEQHGPFDPRPHWGIDRGSGYLVVRLGPVYVNFTTWRHMQRQNLRTAYMTRFKVEVSRWDRDLAKARRHAA